MATGFTHSGTVSNREEFKKYCLRYIGAPFVKINVVEEQLQDRIDEAIEYYQEYHHEGSERTYIKHKITATQLILKEKVPDDFTKGAIKGKDSGATAVIVEEYETSKNEVDEKEYDVDKVLFVYNIKGEFKADEEIYLASDEDKKATITGEVFKGDWDNQYIDLKGGDDFIYSIIKVITLGDSHGLNNLFSLQHQITLREIYDLSSGNFINYKLARQYLRMLDFELRGETMFRYNRRNGKLFLDMVWERDIKVGKYIILECYAMQDPHVVNEVWKDPWLKEYCAALFKRQWGTNIKKFNAFPLPAGIQLDGQAIYSEALEEIKELKADLDSKSRPVPFLIG